jgi:hypothetical protein
VNEKGVFTWKDDAIDFPLLMGKAYGDFLGPII